MSEEVVRKRTKVKFYDPTELVGQTIGRLTLILFFYTYRGDKKDLMFLCKCSCGSYPVVSGHNIRNGKQKSCGCIRTPDLTGFRFGRWLVLGHRKELKKGTRWMCRCDCGTTTYVKHHMLITGKSRSCGCTTRGTLHHSYNPTLTEEERVLRRNYPDYRTWRTAVYRRDDYTCRFCGAKGAYLHAHHILPYSRYPRYRLSLQNGITLCAECHNAYHSLFGKTPYYTMFTWLFMLRMIGKL